MFKAEQKAGGIADRFNDFHAMMNRLGKERIEFQKARERHIEQLQANADAWMNNASYNEIVTLLDLPLSTTAADLKFETVAAALGCNREDSMFVFNDFFGEGNGVLAGDMRIIVDRIVENWRILVPALPTP